MESLSQLCNELYNGMNTLEVNSLSATIKMLISFFLGAIIGLERQRRRESAGMRTITLICIACTGAMLLSIWIPQSYPHFLNGDPGRVAAQVLTGIGFLGAGAIMQSRGSIHGLTTAASIWIVAIVGLCVGAGMYVPALIMTVLSLFILILLERMEKKRLLTGDIKLLVIDFQTVAADIEEIKKMLQEKQIYIYNISIHKNYSLYTTQLEIKIQTKPRETYDELFDEIRHIHDVSAISLTIL